MREKWEELENYECSRYIYTGLGFFLAALFFIFGGIGDIISSSKPAVDLNAMTQFKVGAHVKVDVSQTIGYYWESVMKQNGIDQDYSRKRIYLIPYEAEGKYIGIDVGKNDFERFEQLKEETYTYYESGEAQPQSIGQFEGYIKKCDKRMRNVLEEEFGDTASGSNMEEYVVPYYIELHDDSNGFMFVLCIILAVAGIIIMFVVFPIARKKEIAKRSLGSEQYIGRVIYDATNLELEREETLQFAENMQNEETLRFAEPTQREETVRPVQDTKNDSLQNTEQTRVVSKMELARMNSQKVRGEK
ncbi:MAG: hypothetical protein Q4D51_02355 [Eubacteriales bacterium]|nr:hypothetical protein [Eubacteriales bacterium]